LRPKLVAAVLVGFASVAILRQAGVFFDQNRLSDIARASRGRELLSRIPPDAMVVAQNTLLPHLSQREEIFIFAGDFFETSESATDSGLKEIYSERDIVGEADYIILNRELDPFPLTALQLKEAIARLRESGRFIEHSYERGWLIFEPLGSRP